MRTLLKSRSSNSRKAVATPSLRKLDSDSDLRIRAAAQLAKEIKFIPASDFPGLDGDNAPIEMAIELIDTLRRQTKELQDHSGNPSRLEWDETLSYRDWYSEAPLLSFDQEQVLFRALNLLRFRANLVRRRLSPSAPSRKAMDLIDEMLGIAEQIRTQLVNSNLRLVTSIARKFSGRNNDLDEFISDGSMILLGAIDRFDYSRGFRFSTYATHSIQRHFYRYWKTRQRRKERFPNAGAELLCQIPHDEAEEPLCDDPETVVNSLMAKAETILDDREQQILRSRFGLKSGHRQAGTLREIAVDLGISKERVRQLQLKALEKLRGLMSPESALLQH